MPIEVDSEIRIFSQNEFHELAHQVMGIAFGVHNDFGRLMEEGIYQHAIQRRCETAGIVPARREVEIRVRHEEFQKSYFMDLLFASGLMLELKTVEALNNAHHAQALNYLLLTGMRRIPIHDGDTILGTHEVCLIADDTALALTSLTDGKLQMKEHLQRFLGHTELAYIQWINVDKHDIEFQTLARGMAE